MHIISNFHGTVNDYLYSKLWESLDKWYAMSTNCGGIGQQNKRDKKRIFRKSCYILASLSKRDNLICNLPHMGYTSRIGYIYQFINRTLHYILNEKSTKNFKFLKMHPSFWHIPHPHKLSPLVPPCCVLGTILLINIINWVSVMFIFCW